MFGVDDVIGLGIGAAETVVGFINKGKADREAKELAETRPKETASPFLKDQLNLAESNLGSGMGADAKKIYSEGIDTSLSASLDAILKGGGSTNNVGEIFNNSVNGRQRMVLMNENIRQNNVNNLVRAQDASDEERQRMFEFNQWMPWSDKAQANAQARQGAEQQIWKGLDTAAGVGMKSVEKSRSSSDFDNYFQKMMDNSKPDGWYGMDSFNNPNDTPPSEVQQQRLQY